VAWWAVCVPCFYLIPFRFGLLVERRRGEGLRRRGIEADDV